MKVYLDKMDEDCTPAILYCCPNLFQNRLMLDFKMAQGQMEVVMVLNDRSFSHKMAHCPFCGAEVKVLRGQVQVVEQ